MFFQVINVAIFAYMIVATLAKKELKMVQTSARSEITLSSLHRMTSEPPSDPFLDRKGLIVGHESLDLGPPAHCTKK